MKNKIKIMAAGDYLPDYTTVQICIPTGKKTWYVSGHNFKITIITGTGSSLNEATINFINRLIFLFFGDLHFNHIKYLDY